MKYLIMKYHYYCEGTCNAPSTQYLTDDDGELLEFETKADAEKYIDEQGFSTGVYCLAHGEYSRPKYSVERQPKLSTRAIKYKVGEEVEGGVVIDPDSLPAGVQDELDNDNVEYYSTSIDSIETWRTEIDRDEYDDEGEPFIVFYGINYYIMSEITQLAMIMGDGLDCIDWQNPIYTRRVY